MISFSNVIIEDKYSLNRVLTYILTQDDFLCKEYLYKTNIMIKFHKGFLKIASQSTGLRFFYFDF